MQKWLQNLSLRYKVILTALLIESTMFGILVGYSVYLNNAELQSQGRQRVQEISQTLVAALGPWLSQQADSSVRDILLTRYNQGQLTAITVRDNFGRVLHQVGGTARGGCQGASRPCPGRQPAHLRATSPRWHGRPLVPS